MGGIGIKPCDTVKKLDQEMTGALACLITLPESLSGDCSSPPSQTSKLAAACFLYAPNGNSSRIPGLSVGLYVCYVAAFLCLLTLLGQVCISCLHSAVASGKMQTRNLNVFLTLQPSCFSTGHSCRDAVSPWFFKCWFKAAQNNWFANGVCLRVHRLLRDYGRSPRSTTRPK